MVYEYVTKKLGHIFYPSDIDQTLLDEDLVLWNGFDREKNMWVVDGVHTPNMTEKLYVNLKVNGEAKPKQYKKYAKTISRNNSQRSL